MDGLRGVRGLGGWYWGPRNCKTNNEKSMVGGLEHLPLILTMPLV